MQCPHLSRLTPTPLPPLRSSPAAPPPHVPPHPPTPPPPPLQPHALIHSQKKVGRRRRATQSGQCRTEPGPHRQPRHAPTGRQCGDDKLLAQEPRSQRLCDGRACRSSRAPGAQATAVVILRVRAGGGLPFASRTLRGRGCEVERHPLGLCSARAIRLPVARAQCRRCLWVWGTSPLAAFGACGITRYFAKRGSVRVFCALSPPLPFSEVHFASSLPPTPVGSDVPLGGCNAVALGRGRCHTGEGPHPHLRLAHPD